MTLPLPHVPQLPLPVLRRQAVDPLRATTGTASTVTPTQGIATTAAAGEEQAAPSPVDAWMTETPVSHVTSLMDPLDDFSFSMPEDLEPSSPPRLFGIPALPSGLFVARDSHDFQGLQVCAL
jgi:hypothetical protein